MMVRCIVIPERPDRPPCLRELASVGDFQEVVGGWLEPVAVDALGATFYMNEATIRQHGPLNARATALAWYYRAGMTELRFLLGDVVVAGSGDDADGTDVPEELESGLLGRHQFVIQGCPGADGTWRDTYARLDNLPDAALWCLLMFATVQPATLFRIQADPPITRTLLDSLRRGE